MVMEMNEATCDHIAFVMDGNGRWATQKGLPRSKGHEAGADALFEILDALHQLKMKWVTVYGFSTENWNRPEDETDQLFDFSSQLILNRRNELIEKGVRVYFAGSNDGRIPKALSDEMKKTQELSAKNTDTNLIVAFNYGGRNEVVDAVRQLASNGTDLANISEADISSYLYVPEAPYPDLVVRTSGECRISNFLIWQIAYSELKFLDVLWPDFTPEHLHEVLAEYEQRERRYGGLNGESSETL